MWVACTYIVTTLYKKYAIHAKHAGAMHTRVRVHTHRDACACIHTQAHVHTFSHLKKTGRSVILYVCILLVYILYIICIVYIYKENGKVRGTY